MTKVLAMVFATLACSSGELTSPRSTDSNATTGGPTVGSVVISPPASNDLTVGQSLNLVGTVKSTSGQDISTLVVTWTSSDPTVASVTPTGSLSALKVGTAIISASSSGKSSSLTVNVKAAGVGTVVVVVQNALVVAQSAAATFVATDAAGGLITGRPVAWASRNPSVAVISATGLVSGISAGSTTIEATVDGIVGSANILVTPAAVSSIAVGLTQGLASPGQTATATAVVTDAAGFSLTNKAVTWSSSNSSVATVSQAGIVLAVGSGTTTITAAADGKSGSASFTVSVPQAGSVATVNLSVANSRPLLGATSQVSATLHDASGTLLTNRPITWTTSNAAVAAVSPAGLVTATGLGTAIISAASGNAASTVTIQVLPAPVSSVVVTGPPAPLQPSQTVQLSVSLKDASGGVLTNRIVTFSSASPAVATVSATGLVTAIARGSAVVTVTSEGVVSTVTVTVPPVALVNVSAASAVLQPATTTQATAALLDGSGTPAINRLLAWTSSNPAVATVSASGIVTAVSVGASTITATSEGISGTLAVVIPAVNTVTVTTTTGSLTAGGTTQATATLRDASNALASNRAITWSSGSPAVATVSATGLVTGVATGTADISATSEGKTGVFTVTIGAPGGTIALTTPQNSLMVNQQTQMTAVVTNTLGAVVPNASVVWTSSDSTRATVSQGGLVRQVSGGSLKNITITARFGTAAQTSAIQLVGHPVETIAALPQQYINTALPAAPDVGGVVISVASGGNLQSALNAAQLGDVIELANGAVFTGNFVLANKGAGTKWITIRPASMSGMPAPGSRMTPTIAAAVRLPVIQTPNSSNAISTAAGAHHYRFIGIEMTVQAGVALNYAPIALASTTGQSTLAQVPHNFVLDRVYIHGSATLVLRRCLLLNSAFTAVIDSDLRECHDNGSDSQAIAGYNGPGPFKIVNNYLEGAGENVMFGGSDPTIAGLIPSDIEIRRNHFFKPTAWKGSQWVIKNHLELKNAGRVLIEGNIFENNWAHGQDGTSILFKSVNQNNNCLWCSTQDVTMRYNVIRNVGSGFSIAGSPDLNVTNVHARRINIHDNLITDLNTGMFTGAARGFVMGGDPAFVIIAHNTVMPPTSGNTMNSIFAFGPAGMASISWTARDNVIHGGTYGLIGDNVAGGAAFARYAPGGTFVGNVMIYGLPAGYPTGNSFTPSIANVGFANAAGANYALAPTSPYKNTASDGTDPGADLTAVATATAGVIVP